MDNKMLKPCDCVSIEETMLLHEQGIAFNDEGITIIPNYVLLRMGHTEIKISMKRFKQFSEWYLEPQEIKNMRIIPHVLKCEREKTYQ